MDRMHRSEDRANREMRHDGRVNRFVEPHARVYVNTYRPYFYTRYDACNGYYHRWGAWYRPWYGYGFYGGWYWGLRPVYDIHEYFWNPLIFWLYVDAWDDYYYQRWYGSDYWQYPQFHQHFSRPGVYYPTEALRDLALGVSSMSAQEQINFRTGLVTVADRLEQALSERLGYQATLGRNDIVVTHYQMLEDSAVLDGFVSADAQQFPFKAFIDLVDPNNDSAFIPSADGQVSDAQLYELRQMNEMIEQRGGTNEFPQPELSSDLQ